VVDTFKSPDGVVACKIGVCEDDCEEEELARAIDLPLLINSNKILKMDLSRRQVFEKGFLF